MIDTWFRTATELAGLVEHEVTRRVGPTLRTRFDRGDRLDFGAISISSTDGIEIGRRVVPWDGIAEFSLAEEKLTIREREDGSEHTVPVSRLKNARVCVDIIRGGVASTGSRS